MSDEISPDSVEEAPAEEADAVFAQGFRWEGDDPRQLREVVEAAFDYRGDVTLLLREGDDLKGYLANRVLDAEEPYLELFLTDGGAKRRVRYSELVGIEFSGKDTASGKSWETWVKKWEEKKAAEARGEEIGSIGLFPEEIE